MKKVKQLKGFVIAKPSEREKQGVDRVSEFYVFTQDEWDMGQGMRYPEWECDSLSEAEEWVMSE